MAVQEILVPDIGNFDSVDVIEVLVKAGDSLAKDDSIMTVESDKASMDIPAPVAGVVKEVNIKVGEIFMGAGQLKVVNTDRLKLTSQVPENYAGKIKVGTDVSLIFPDLNKTMDTKLTVVGNVIDPLSRSFL